MKKKILSGLLSGVMLLSALNGVPALAAPGEVPPEGEIPVADEIGEPVPYGIYQFRADIDLRDFDWYQAPTHQYYSIKITNTSDVTIKCYLTTPEIPSFDDLETAEQIAMKGLIMGATIDVQTKLSSIAPGKTVVAVNNSYAQPGEYRLAFTYDTSIGVSPGTVLVETSNTKF